MSDTIHATDILVVGAGPAGIAAACAASESGRRVTVVESSPWIGGQIWRDTNNRPAARAERWFTRLRAARASLFKATTVVAAPESHLLLAESPRGPIQFRWDRLILAVGARELFLPFPGWALPNVFGPGGLQLLVKAGWPVTGKRVVVAGSGPLLIAAAAHLRQAGARVVTVAEQARWQDLARFGLALPRLAPAKLAQGLAYQAQLLGVPYRPGSWVLEAHGRDRVDGVVLTNGSSTRSLACDILACAFGLVPNTELPALLGCRIEDQRVQVDAHQRTSVADVFCAGEPTGVGGVDQALVEGQIAGYAAAGRPEPAAALLAARARTWRFRNALERAFALRPELQALAKPSTLFCRCEDVRRHQLEPYPDWPTAKLHTRCGMGPCQGRVCGPATRVLLGWDPSSVRPPILPARVATLMASIESEVRNPVSETPSS